MAEELAEERCQACRADAHRLTEHEIAGLRHEVPDWKIEEQDGVPRLTRVFPFEDFNGAMDFAMQVGEAAEEEGHHPALLVEWGRVTVSWWTHKIRGLHRNDFIMAARTDDLAGE